MTKSLKKNINMSITNHININHPQKTYLWTLKTLT